MSHKEISDPEEEKEQLSTSIEDDDFGDDDRVLWSKKVESMLSFVGLCVGLGNLWRFPYLCMRNGGGAFLIPFVICLIVCGFPLFFLELSLAQFTGKDAMHTFEVCPIFRGIGIGMVAATCILAFYYNAIIAWTMFYIGNSFMNPLPWRSCDNEWNTEFCVTTRNPVMYGNMSQGSNISDDLSQWTNYTNSGLDTFVQTDQNVTYLKHKYVTSEEEFWQYKTLDVSSGIDDFGGMPWHLAVCFFAAWVLVALCLIKGVKSIGKVVYITASLPYILLTIILLRALLLPGATDGILFYLTPDFNKLAYPQVWVEAALQVFYSLCPGWGQLLTMASYNKFHNNCYRDSIILTCISEGTSIFGGFVVFAVVGFMAHEAQLPIATVVKSGPGLGFVVYPEALAQLPLPNLWSFLFFIMLLSVALDSEFACMEVVIAAIVNHFPKFRKRQVLVTVCTCIVFFLVGLVFCTQAGIYVYQLLDWYVALSIPVFGLIECLIFGWIYGAQRFSNDIEMMLGRGIPIIFRLSWCIVMPVVLVILFVFTIATYKAPIYGDYVYPSYVNMVGWMIGLFPLIPVIVVAVYTVINTSGDSISQKIKTSFQPSSKWKPISRKHALNYDYRKNTTSSGLCQRIKVNLLGN